MASPIPMNKTPILRNRILVLLQSVRERLSSPESKTFLRRRQYDDGKKMRLITHKIPVRRLDSVTVAIIQRENLQRKCGCESKYHAKDAWKHWPQRWICTQDHRLNRKVKVSLMWRPCSLRLRAALKSGCASASTSEINSRVTMM